MRKNLLYVLILCLMSMMGIEALAQITGSGTIREEGNTLAGQISSNVNLQSGRNKNGLDQSIITTGDAAVNANQISERYQSVKVTGKVTSMTDGTGIPGVNVVVKDTQNGTITDIDGNYSIEVGDANATLVFSYVGYISEEVNINGRSVVNVALSESIEALQEIVVTALGIKREERSLGYAVGRVEGKDIDRVAQENVLNSLAGKIPGVTINSTGGTGSSVSMVIRGATSLSSDNQPLFVVDGVPLVNTLNNVTQIGSDNRVDYGNAISDINPDDIASITVLKGPSAAALYGSRAGNGVVLITTKSASKSKGVSVSVSSNTVFDEPYKYVKRETKFAAGYFSFTPDDFPPGYFPTIDYSQAAGAGMELNKGYYAVQWDSPLDANGVPVPKELISHPNNVADFVQTGVTTTNGISISNRNDVMDYRVGFNNMSSRGLIPNSDLFRNNLTLNASSKVHEKLVISTNINVNRSWSNNRPSSNRGTNPLQWAYAVPPDLDIALYKNYWEPGKEGFQQRTPDNDTYNNPYFLAHEVNNSFIRDRIFGNLKGEWQITPEFSLMGRYALDYYTETRETKIAPSYSGEPNNGAYGIVNLRNYERNADFLATYNKDLGEFSLSVSAGGNALLRSGANVTNASAPSSGLVVPGVYSINNIKSGALDYSSSRYEKVIYSAYALANIAWNNMVYLDLTARNDWSSTLPPENQSYFYPSASLSFLLNEMLPVGDQFNLIKLRGGWAKVGNDADPYSLYPTYADAGQWGDATRLSKSGTILTPDLKPEEATSWETGLDFGMFNNRVRFEGTYYQVDNRNQIIRNIPIAPSSGFDQININAGKIESTGWEFMLGGTPIQQNGWNWDISVNFSRNRTRVVELSDGVDLIKFWSDAKGGAWAYTGDELGNIYDSKIVVVEDKNSPYYGYPIVGGGDNEWQSIDAKDTKNVIGNYNPDFLAGLQTSLSYKGFTLNMSFDWRHGGQFVSQTYRYMSEDASSQIWLDGLINPGGRTGKELRDWLVANEDQYIKNGFHVVGGPTAEYGGFPEKYSGITVNDGTFVPGVVAVSDGEGGTTYVENLGENNPLPYMPYVVSYPWDFTKPSTFDADFVKLREISLTYQLPPGITKQLGLQNANVSVYSRNIILWTKAKINIDPERAFQAESSTQGNGIQFKQGIERYNVDPWVIPVGFKIGLTF